MATRTSIRCSTRIFFTLASRSGTSRIVYDLSKEPPAAAVIGGTALPTTRRLRLGFPERCEARATPAEEQFRRSLGWLQRICRRVAPHPRGMRPVSKTGCGRQRQRLRKILPAKRLPGSLDRYDCNVVVTTPRVRQRDEFLRLFLERRLEKGVADLIVVDQVREAVGAEQKLVTRARLHPHHVDEHVLLEAHRAGDDVLEAAVARFFLAEKAGADLLVHERVIVGELVDVALAHQVGAAVADMADEGLTILDQERDAGRGHATHLGIGAAGAEDRRTGGLAGLAQRGRQWRVGERDLNGERGVAPPLRREQLALDGLDGHAARRLAP